MRVLLASDFFPPSSGGMEAHVERLAKALIERGHEVAVVTATRRPAAVPGALTATASSTLAHLPRAFEDPDRAYPPPFRDPLFMQTVRRTAESWKPDVIHAHGWCAFSCYWSGSPPLVVTVHDHGLRCPKKTLLRGKEECVRGRSFSCVRCTGEQSVAKRVPMALALAHSVRVLNTHVARFIAVSQSVAGRLSESSDFVPPIDVVPNFIDTRVHRGGARPNRRVILFVGPDSAHKGRAVLVEAFAQLRSGLAELDLVGAGSRVRGDFITNSGYEKGEALAEHFRSAAVVAVPSVWPEPCPTVALEAFAYGKPVIASRIGGLPDLVEHGRSGLLVAPNDASELSRALASVLSDGGLQARLAQGLPIEPRCSTGQR